MTGCNGFILSGAKDLSGWLGFAGETLRRL